MFFFKEGALHMLHLHSFLISHKINFFFWSLDDLLIFIRYKHASYFYQSCDTTNTTALKLQPKQGKILIYMTFT